MKDTFLSLGSVTENSFLFFFIIHLLSPELLWRTKT